MPVEEVLVLDQRVVVAQLHDGVVIVALPQPAKPRVRQPFQSSPQHFVLHSAHIENHSPVERPALEDHPLVGDEGGDRVAAMDDVHVASSPFVPVDPARLPSDPAVSATVAPLVVAQYDHLIFSGWGTG